MRKIENDCVGCCIPCSGLGCSLANVEHIYCDDCGKEIFEDDDIFESISDGSEYCRKCAKKYEEFEDDLKEELNES